MRILFIVDITNYNYMLVLKIHLIVIGVLALIASYNLPKNSAVAEKYKPEKCYYFSGHLYLKSYLHFSMFCFAVFYFMGGSGSQKNSETSIRTGVNKVEEVNKVEIAGVYSGTDNIGMESTIVLRSGGTLIIHASVGDGTPDYGRWTGSADNLSLYHKDVFGNDEFVGNAKVTKTGLRIKGGKFYSRQ